jgi:tricarballylate dehydrogenase
MTKQKVEAVDVVVLGDGIAGCTAAMAAQTKGAKVLIVEKSTKDAPHGNTAYSGGALRRVSSRYPERKYYQDLMTVTERQADPALSRITIRNSKGAKAWLRRLGIRWTLPSSNIHRADGVVGKGPVLASTLRKAIAKEEIPVLYATRALALSMRNGQVKGVKIQSKKGVETIACRAVVIATGGFQANRTMVVRHLGKGAERLVLRGYKGSTGDGHEIARKIGASLIGMNGYHGGIIHYGYRKFPWAARERGLRSVKRYEKAVLVNQKGIRFVDEGEYTADKTYAKFGKIIALTQPGGVAYLVFDSRARNIIRPMYEGPEKGPVKADTIEGLAKKLSINPTMLSKTIKTFNSAVKGGKAVTLSPPKTNFAQRIEKAPFYAYKVTGGMTFTFGGIKINPRSEVLGSSGKPIPGAYAAGEVTGGFFFHNYPAGSSLTRCTVFGRIAGENAAKHARRRNLH